VKKTLPTEAERRRRLLTRTLPLAIVAVIAFALGAAAGKEDPPEKQAAARFTAAWSEGDFTAMYAELNPASRREISEAEFTAAYREAKEVATLRGLVFNPPQDPSGEDPKQVAVTATADTADFGVVEEPLELTFDEGGIVWDPSLAFPGLDPGERLESNVELAPRAPILAADGTVLAEGEAGARTHPLGSAAIDVTGEVGTPEEGDLAALARQGFPAGTPVGISGVELALNSRLAGKPGGTLLAVSAENNTARVLAKARPRPGTAVKTTIDPDLQLAAVSALGGRSGGVAVLDSRTGNVRALAGQAFSAPQPPGSTFKMITTAAALEKDIVSLDDYFPITDGVNVGGRFISNANGEFCGGSFREAFAESCNADFAPLGPKIGNDDLVETAERFGFNSPPTLYASRIVDEIEPAESSIPTVIGDELDLGVTAIGQGEVLATPLQMASVAQTIAADGVRMPTSLVANRKLRPQAQPERVMTKKIAGQLTELMIGVVTSGTGFAGAIPEAQVAGKTGTAELGPEPGQEDEPEPTQIKDAWFAAFAPAEKPRLTVSVVLIDAGAAGGEVAAPAAAEILSAGL
jgi:cell division protein FtsI/penicillin-binding protein 2